MSIKTRLYNLENTPDRVPAGSANTPQAEAEPGARLLPSYLDAAESYACDEIDMHFDTERRALVGKLCAEVRACWLERDEVIALAARGVAIPNGLD